MRDHPTADLLEQAAHYFRSGDLEAAEHILAGVLAARPREPAPLHLLGVIKALKGDHAEAIKHYEKALRSEPGNEDLRINLALALAATGRFKEVLLNMEKAIALNPASARAYSVRANALGRLGRPAESLAGYDKALSLNPQDAETWSNRGATLNDLERYDEALASFDKALALDAGYAPAWSNRVTTLSELGNFEEALASAERALALEPGLPEAWLNRGTALSELGRYAEALASYDRALELRPDYVQAHGVRGSMLARLGRPAEALACYDKAVSFDARYAEAWGSRGLALHELGRYDEALASYEHALSIAPGGAYLFGDWLHNKMMLCEWAGIEEAFGRAFAGIEAGRKVCAPFALLAMPSSAALQKKNIEIYVGDKFPDASRRPAARTGRGAAQITLGYLSSDFHEHATAYLTAELFELHDRGRFRVNAYSYGPDDRSPMRARLENAFDRFVEVGPLADAAAAAAIQADGVDILIDLKGYTARGRPGIVALRPAPVQVSFLGYPGTMGARLVDYLVADRFVAPPELAHNCSEKLVYLPGTYQVNDRKRAIGETPPRAALGLPETGFVFCSFNQAYKILPDVFASWMRLLGTVPRSVLWLLEGHPKAVANLRREAQARGIDPARLIFAGSRPLQEHLGRLRAADLFLDTAPYNAHTSASDALWTGVPVVSCPGESFASRVAGSLLNALGMPELVAASAAAYENLAAELAADAQKLASIRAKIARNAATHPLFDAPRFAKNLERAYEKMEQTYRSGALPGPIDVAG